MSRADWAVYDYVGAGIEAKCRLARVQEERVQLKLHACRMAHWLTRQTDVPLKREFTIPHRIISAKLIHRLIRASKAHSERQCFEAARTSGGFRGEYHLDTHRRRCCMKILHCYMDSYLSWANLLQNVARLEFFVLLYLVSEHLQ
jgi:hypothetical protein